jgi:hypothetical protein
MKKYIPGFLALMILTSVAVSSCAVRYDDDYRYNKRHDHGYHDHHDRNYRGHDYNHNW